MEPRPGDPQVTVPATGLPGGGNLFYSILKPRGFTAESTGSDVI